MTRSLIAALAGACLFAAPALADEVWSSEIGDIIYEADIGDYAVLSFEGDGGTVRYNAFVDGLGMNYDDRSRHDGYWTGPMGDGGVECAVSIIDHAGLATNNWGRVEVVFVDRAFPSTFIAQRGECFDEPRDALVAKPIVGE